MLFLLLLICWPVAEVFVAIKVGEAIGALPTILLLIASWPLGAWVLRSQGRAAWRRLSAAVAEGRTPGREVIDGALVLAGGFLLMIPGFITDVVGLVLLLAPTRILLRMALQRNFRSRLVSRTVRFTQRHYDVDSTAHDIDPPPLKP
jgi:UPF0716 protein FxsA